MRKLLLKVVKEERGAQIIEFILVFPLIWFLFIFSVDQFMIVYNKQKALAAAYEAGRFASVQPSYRLAQYYAESHAAKELEQALSLEQSEVELIVDGKWRKGNHVEVRVDMTFPLLASKEIYTIQESYTMMIESPVE